MKNIIIAIALCLAMCSFALAQSKFPELEKIKQIKLLESTRQDVVKTFGYLNEDPEDESSSEEIEATDEKTSEAEEAEEEEIDSDHFSTDDLRITFRYSLGNCSDDDEEEWNVAKGKVTEINIIFRESVKAEDLKIALSKLEKIREDEPDEDNEIEEEEDPDDFIYYDKQKGVSYGLSDGKIENIKFTPAEENLSALCSNETVREDHPSNKEWLINKLRQRPYMEIREGFASVDELILSNNELTADCPATEESKTENEDDYFKLAVETKSASGDPTDVLTYNYTVSGGKIIGRGANVVWDLSGVKPGSYTITAGVDNGCGVCGTTKTETVVVKEPDCSQKPE